MRHFLIAGLALALAAPAAVAKDKGEGHGKGRGNEKNEKKEDKGDRDDDRGHGRQVRVIETRAPSRVVVFSPSDRTVIRDYYVTSYGRGCPPGLAKKNNGCLPPGQANKRYVVGRVLPRTVVYDPLPGVLVQRLTPLPAGYQYVVVDGDVLKLAVGTRLVVDAIRHIY